MQRTLLGVDIAALVLSFLYLWGALGYPRGTMDQPGPGLYPLFVGTLLVIASIGSILTDLLKPAQGELDIPKGKNLGRMLIVAGAAPLYGRCWSLIPVLTRSNSIAMWDIVPPPADA